MCEELYIWCFLDWCRRALQSLSWTVWDLLGSQTACLYLTLSFLVHCCCFHLSLCVVQFCLCFGVRFPYGINFEIKGPRRRTASYTRENGKGKVTLFVGNDQCVHNSQERVARQILHVTANSNQSDKSNVSARRIACACWPALVGI